MDRLLTDKEIQEIKSWATSGYRHPPDFDIATAAAKAQDAKTAKLKDEEWQARIQGIFEEIGVKMFLEQCDRDVMPYFIDYYWIDKEEWQALWEKYCGKKEE